MSTTDLAFLERFCQGDRARMVKYIDLYLAEAPAYFAQLEQALVADDAAQLAAAAHDLRPMMHQMGAPHLMALLTDVEARAKAEGAVACTPLVGKVLALREAMDGALRDARSTLAIA